MGEPRQRPRGTLRLRQYTSTDRFISRLWSPDAFELALEAGRRTKRA
ncbi:BnaA06g34990D [Brassica napus]|uniref:BnaA06g34990D protein n=2 Tax=Brassica TaxID=3705 RepID=A0A078FT13_BRANA|nr:BnaA06g34990D [Brassica napus]